MRPEAPARYRPTVFETPIVARRLGTVGRMVLRNVTRTPMRAAASIFGIAFAVAILMVGLVFSNAIDQLIVTQFSVAERQDVTISFVEPRSPDAQYALAHLPGVVSVEPQRQVAARIRAGHRQRYLSVTGVPPNPRLKRIVDGNGRTIRVPPAGVVLSKTLADVLGVTAGDRVTIDVLEGTRPVRDVDVAGLVDDVLGLSVYMDLSALHAMMREGDVTSGALLLVDAAEQRRLSRELKELPAIAGASFRTAVLASFRETMAANMNLTIALNVLFASVIALGVV
jgi:putative ABC transport system permease protein